MKYMITGIGESEIILTGNSKSKLTKEALQIAKSSYEAYIENCKYLQEEPTAKFEDFKSFQIDDYDKSFINTLTRSYDFQLL